MSDTRSESTCRKCHAPTEYSSADKALKCKFCGHVSLTEAQPDTRAAGPQAIVPLLLDQTALTDAIYELLASGDHTPDHLLEHATFTSKELFYVPVYRYHVEYEAQWTASFGFDRTEHYTEAATRRENGREYQVIVNKTKTVTDWRPTNGKDEGKTRVRAYAGARLLQSSLGVAHLVETMPLNGTVVFDTSYTATVPAEEFKLDEDAAFNQRAKSVVDAVIENSVKKHAQGDRQKDWHWTKSISKEGTTTYVPVAHAVYEFEGKSFNVWTSGLDASQMVSDPLPVDQRRKRNISFGFIPATLGAVATGVALYKYHAAWMAPAIAIASALGYGWLRQSFIIRYSKKLRQHLLSVRQAAAANTAAMSADAQASMASSLRAPTKPFFIATGFDRAALPIIALACIVTPLFDAREQLLHPHQDVVVAATAVPAMVPSAPAARTSGPRSAAVAAQPKPVETLVEPATVSPPADGGAQSAPSDAATASVQDALPAKDTAAPVAAVSVAASAPLNVPAPIQSIVAAASAGQWQSVDEQVAQVAQQRPATHSGSVLAHLANTLGIAAIRRNDSFSAVSEFRRGVAADPNNVELRNNYGYALQMNGQSAEAARELGETLMMAPDRSAAWANLSEAIAADVGSSVATLELALRFSRNRQHTLDAYAKMAETHPNEQYRANIKKVLEQSSQVTQVVAAAD